jgi:DNA-binding IclR family transcriptional regulator
MDGVVKSAGRALSILDFFARAQRPSTASELQAALAIPQSSISALLQSLVDLGYLCRDPQTREYFPSVRVLMLGDWLAGQVTPGLSRETLADLSRSTGEGVLVGRQRGTRLQYINCIGPDRATPLAERPLVASSSGRAILSAYAEASVRKIVRRNNAEATLAQHRLREDAVVAAVRKVRETGISETAPDLGGEHRHHTISVAVPTALKSDLVSVGVFGARQAMLSRRDEIIGILRDWKRSALAGAESLPAR